MESAARSLLSLQILSSAQSRFQVSCSNASPLPGATEVGGHDLGKHYLLSTWYVLQQHSVVPGTVHCCCCIMYHTKIEATKKCRVSRSDLQQQQRCSIMHPSGHPAARQQRCSHVPIPRRAKEMIIIPRINRFLPVWPITFPTLPH